MKRPLILLLLLCPGLALAQDHRPRATTVGNLPATCSPPGRLYPVTDANPDCSTGGGSILALCACNAAGNGYDDLPSTDAIGTDELDDDANTPSAGDVVIVETGDASFDYITPNGDTDITADLEEETHATEHAGQGLVESGDSLSFQYTATLTSNNLGVGECIFSDDSGGGLLCEGTADDTAQGLLAWPVTTSDKTLTLPDATDTLVGRDTTDALTNKTIDTTNTVTINASDITDQHASTDITADLEEEGEINATAVTGNAADDQVLLGSGASAIAYATVPDCNTENMLTYTQGTNTWGCESDSDSGGSPAWEALVNTADTATSYVSSADAETFTIDFQSAFSADRFIIKQTTGNPTAGGSLFNLEVADADVNIMEAVGLGSTTLFLLDDPGDVASGEVFRLAAPNRATAADNDEACIEFWNEDSGSASEQFSEMCWAATDVTTTEEDGALIFNVRVAGSLVEGMRLVSDGTDDVQLALRESADITQPILALDNDRDSGIYASGDDTLAISLGGAVRVIFADGGMRMSPNGPELLPITPTNTNPSMVADVNDSNTGVGKAAEDQFTIVAGNDEAWTFAEGAYGTAAGDSVAFVSDLVTAPTSNPTGGVLLYSDADTLYIRDTGGTVSDLALGASGAAPGKEHYYMASGTLALEHTGDSIAPLVKEEGTNVDDLVAAFDDTTDECRGGTLTVPGEVDTGGTATFRARWYAATAPGSCASDCTAFWDFKHVPRDDAENWDSALTAESTSDDSSTTQDVLTETTWTETVSTMGWIANDVVLWELCRDANNGSDDLTGDAYLVDFTIEIPRTGAANGDIDQVGDCTSGTCFNGAQGTQIVFETAGANDVTLDAASAASAFTVTLPAETGTACTTGSICTGYAGLAGPALTGDPTAPTAAVDDNDTSIATTAFVQQEHDDSAGSCTNQFVRAVNADAVPTCATVVAADIESAPAISGANIDSFPENFCKTLFDSGGLADTDDVSSLHRFKGASTVTEVWCETDTGTATITLEDGSGNDLTTSCSCDNTGDTGNTCTLTGNIAYTDGELLDLLMVTAAGNRLTFCVEYDLD
jgi:hypothetical protein